MTEIRKERYREDKRRVAMWNRYINGKIGKMKLCEWWGSDMTHIEMTVNKIRERQPDLNIEYQHKAWKARKRRKECNLYDLRERYMEEQTYRAMAQNNWWGFLRELGVSL